MSVLITGGAGYIGSHIAWAMYDRGDMPIIIDNLSTSSRDGIPQDILFYDTDIGDTEAVGQIIKEHEIKSVIHLAAATSVSNSLDDPLSYYRKNTSTTKRLIDICLSYDVENFIFSSTAAVYGNPLSAAPVKEDAPAFPQSPYGFSKLLSERHLIDASHAHANFNIAILRYFNVAGADAQGRTGQATPTSESLIKIASETAAGQRTQMQINGQDYNTPDGTCIRDYIHVSDLANAHLATLDKMHDTGEDYVFNCGYGKGYSVQEIVQEMENVAGAQLNYIVGPRRDGDIISITADNSKIMSLTDWRAEFDDLKLMLQSAYQWELNQKQKIAC